MKVFKKESAAEVAKAKRELSILTDIDHPSIVTLLEICETKEAIHLIFKNYESDLFLASKAAQLSYLAIKKIVYQLALFLKHFHDLGYSHNDIKPENLLLDGENTLKICDFESSAKGQDTATFISVTALYADPELKDGEFGPDIDMWSFGITLFVLLTGYFPFNEKSEENSYAQVAKAIEEAGFDQETANLISGLCCCQEERLTAEEVLLSDYLAKIELSWEMIPKIEAVKKIMEVNLLVFAVMLHRTYNSNTQAEVLKTFRQLDMKAQGSVEISDLTKFVLKKKLVRKNEIDCLMTKLDILREGRIGFLAFSCLFMSPQVTELDVERSFKTFDFGNKSVLTIDDIAFVLKPKTKNDLQELKLFVSRFEGSELRLKHLVELCNENGVLADH